MQGIRKTDQTSFTVCNYEHALVHDAAWVLNMTLRPDGLLHLASCLIIVMHLTEQHLVMKKTEVPEYT